MGETEPGASAGAPAEDTLRALSERLGRAMSVIRDAMRAIAASQEDIEKRLREVAGEQQERFIEFAKAYSERARALEQRVAAAVKAAEDAAGSAVAAIEAQREGLAAEIAARIEAGSPARSADGSDGARELAAAQQQMIQAVQMLRVEVEAVSARIQEWGRGEVGDRVAQAVAAQVEGILERRFEALAQLLESRIKQAAPPPAEEPRGLFRRSR